MDKRISPSIMCVDFLKLEDTLRQMEASGIEYIHVDVMDGHFVPNYTLGTDFIKTLKAATDIPLDLHLMIDDPEQKLAWFAFGDGDLVSVHAESTKHLHKAVAAIRARGAKAMVALNPATPLCMLDSVLDDIDGVLLMTVDPGFAGGSLVESTLPKIRALRDRLDQNGYAHLPIEVDGNVSFVNAQRMKEAGADIFVAGTSSIFNPAFSLSDGISKLRAVLNE